MKEKKKGITKKMQQQHALCLLLDLECCLPSSSSSSPFSYFLASLFEKLLLRLWKEMMSGRKEKSKKQMQAKRWKSWRKGIEIESVLEQFVSLLRTKSILLFFFSRRTVSEFVMCFSFRLHSLTSLSSSNKKRKLPWRRQSFFPLVNKVLEERQRKRGYKKKDTRSTTRITKQDKWPHRTFLSCVFSSPPLTLSIACSSSSLSLSCEWFTCFLRDTAWQKTMFLSLTSCLGFNRRLFW